MDEAASAREDGVLSPDRVSHMPKLPALDGLRAAAILIVMIAHAGLDRIVPGGFGVTIFFFLSGYLITTLLRLEAARTGRVSLKRFYLKRTLRIFPPMYLTIALLAALIAAGWLDKPLTPAGVATDALFLTNYAPELHVGAGVPIPLWSLDVEEHFYILFSSLFVLVLARLDGRRAALLCLAMIGVVLAVRVAIAMTADDLSRIFYWSHTRIDSILWGCVLALWHNPAVDRDAWRPRLWQFAGALLLLLLCLAIRHPLFRETLRYTFQGAALLVVFSYVLHDRGWIRRVLGSAPLRVVALVSYTLYLIHMPALMMAEQWRLPLPALSGAAMAFGYAALMYAVVERPLARFRHRA